MTVVIIHTFTWSFIHSFTHSLLGARNLDTTVKESVPDVRDPRVWKERDMNRPSLKGPPMGPGCCGSLEERYPTHAHFIDGKTKVFQNGS